MRPRPRRRTWRSFNRRDRAAIEARLADGGHARCPGCGGFLEARPGTRLRVNLPSGAAGRDLDCRDCRRFYPRIRHTPESLYHMRVRRLASAVLNA